MKRFNFYSDKKFFTKDWVKGEWYTEHVFCGSHYANRYYIVDDYGNLVKVAYLWYGYPYKPNIVDRKDCYHESLLWGHA